MGKHNIRTCVYISIYMYIYIYMSITTNCSLYWLDCVQVVIIIHPQICIYIYIYICILVYLCVCFIHDSESLKIDRVLWCSLLGLHSHDWFPAAIHGMAPSYVLYIYIYRHTLYTLYISYMYIQTAKCLPVTLSVWISCTHIFFGKQ